MKAYEKVYQHLDFPSELIALANGDLKIPRGTEDQPACCYGFPPAMIPLFSAPDSMIYTGYWKHWFGSRSSSFVRMHVNVLFRLTECARSVEQFKDYLVMRELVFADELTSEVDGFARALNVSNLNLLDQISTEFGDRPAGFLHLPSFSNNPPLSCFRDPSAYKGDFPHVGMNIDQYFMSESCSLELNETLENEYLSESFCPNWFKNYKKTEVFAALLDEGKLSEAWFALNSNGWSFIDARKALNLLASKYDDFAFHTLVDAWCSLDHTKYKVGY
ncbi:hypothetical protein ACO0LD_25405 [Undibacterium sp. Ji83W]|uniref:hypothetical protein n=1 Tax=Undibacterium sp. Ji83W TaxID=3413043 RepID=UPI003BF13D7D